MDLSIVVPAYKQAPTIQQDLRNLSAFLDSLHTSYELILVIDGDIDDTAHIVKQDDTLAHVRIIPIKKNHGKGYALKQGFLASSGNIVGFIDAGGDIEFNCLRLMFELMQFTRADIVIGSKRHPLSQVQYPLVRHIYSFSYQLLNRMLFRLNIRDTQVGVKLFRKDALTQILPHVQINKFAFDLELLVHAHALGFTHIIESPVRITHKFNSTIGFGVIIETLYDTIRLYFRNEPKQTSVTPSSGISVSYSPNSSQNTAKERVR